MTCPDCDGHGYRIVPQCCGRFYRDGSCCGEAVPEGEDCGFCAGSGEVADPPFDEPA